MNKKGQVGRVFIAWIIVALGIAFFSTFFWETLNQRIFIPIARWVRFKKDDTEKVSEEVEKILGEDVDKKKSNTKSK
jgi:hypothetical protein